MHRSRRSRLAIALLLAITAAPAGLVATGPAMAATAPCRVLNVGTGLRYTKVQTAVTAAAAGATLTVTGTCVGSVSIIRGLTIQKGTTAAILMGSGGRVVSVSASGTKPVVLSGLVIKGGTATSCGTLTGLRCGAGILNTGLLTLRGVTVTGNTLDAGSSSDAVAGAGIFNAAGARLTITDSIVKANKATGPQASGGGIANRGRLSIATSRIKGNSVTATQAVTGTAAGGGIASTTATAVVGLDGATVSRNTATGPIALGGGIAITDGDLDVLRSVVDTNRANGDGGAGGGIAWASVDGISLIADATISGNVAGSVGGGIVSTIDGLFLQGATITDNEAPTAGGVDGPATVSASIIAGNRATLADAPDDCTVIAADSDAGDNLIGDGRGCDAFVDGQNGTQAGTHAAPIDPVLGTLAANGGLTRTHALLPGSPAIDGAGAEPCATDRDQRGTDRPQGSACDVGAFELTS